MQTLSNIELKRLELRENLDALNDALFVAYTNVINFNELKSWQQKEINIQFLIRRLLPLSEIHQLQKNPTFILYNNQLFQGKDAPIYILQQILDLYFLLHQPEASIHEYIVYGLEGSNLLFHLDILYELKLDLNEIIDAINIKQLNDLQLF